MADLFCTRNPAPGMACRRLASWHGEPRLASALFRTLPGLFALVWASLRSSRWSSAGESRTPGPASAGQSGGMALRVWSGTVPEASVRTVCAYCGVGCGLVLDVAQGADGNLVVTRSSGDRAHPANFGRLCAQRGHDRRHANGPWALDHSPRADGPRSAAGAHRRGLGNTETARRLRRVWERHGPDAVALYVSGQMSMEAQYLANKLAKGFLRTTAIESNSRLCMASAASGYKLSLGADGPPGSYEDFDHADPFLVIGSNMADFHPVLFFRMMDRVKSGARLIVADPRRTTTAEKADLFLQLKPGTDLALLNGLLRVLLDAGRLDDRFIAEFTQGWEEMPAFLEDYPASRVAEITGVPEADLRRGMDRDGRPFLDELLDDGPQPEPPGHLEHQRADQPAPGDRIDLPYRQRTVLTDRPAQRDGRPRDGLHGSRTPRPAGGPGSGGPAVHRGAVRTAPWHDQGRGRRGHRRAVLPDGLRSDQGVLDHLHQSRRLRRQPPGRDQGPAVGWSTHGTP